MQLQQKKKQKIGEKAKSLLLSELKKFGGEREKRKHLNFSVRGENSLLTNRRKNIILRLGCNSSHLYMPASKNFQILY